MRHDLTIEGEAFRLRPVTLDDAQFILDLRVDPERNRFIHPTPNDIELQKRWLDGYFAKPGEYYFIIESKSSGRREGTIGVYSIDPEQLCGEWGRWVILADSIAGLESAVLIYRTAFEVLGLNMLYARTALVNKHVVAFHDACGLERYAILPGFLNLQSGPADAVEHRITRELWNKLKPPLEEKAHRMARILNRKK